MPSGYMKCPYDPSVATWAQAARDVASKLDTTDRRHGHTWFVGVDALPNDPNGAISGVEMPFARMSAHWHRAQVSIIYPGYPKQDPIESDAAHRFRIHRAAAHMDGLLPEGPEKRRHLRERHGFILGLPLNNASDSPLVVWEGSHHIMGAAFARAFDGLSPDQFGDRDVTDIYQSARREVFEKCEQVELITRPGEAILLHRHLIHGVAPWGEGQTARMVAYFRPLIAPRLWLSGR